MARPGSEPLLGCQQEGSLIVFKCFARDWELDSSIGSRFGNATGNIAIGSRFGNAIAIGTDFRIGFAGFVSGIE